MVVAWAIRPNDDPAAVFVTAPLKKVCPVTDLRKAIWSGEA
jgi:hypothetical protein